MVCLVVEGDRDKEFLTYFLEEQMNIKADYRIEKSDGWTKLSDAIITTLRRYIDDDTSICVLYDMDTNDIQTRKNDICRFYEKKGIGLEQDNIFLFPNNEKIGRLETLLFSCVPEDRQFILREFDIFIEKIKDQRGNLDLYLPDDHHKAYTYGNIQCDEGNSLDKKKKKKCPYLIHKEGLYNFRLNNTYHRELQSLLDFLAEHMKT